MILGISESGLTRAFPPNFVTAGSIAGLLRFQNSDLPDARLRQMLVPLHQQKHVTKLLEIDALLRSEGMLHEEWHDAFDQLLALPHSIGHPVAVVLPNHTASEVGLDRVQELRIAFVLDDGELG